MASKSLGSGTSVPKGLKGNKRPVILSQVFILYEMMWKEADNYGIRKEIYFYKKITQAADILTVSG